MGGLTFITMKMLGPSLYDVVRQQRLDMDLTVELARQMVSLNVLYQLVALENLHALGYSHCDVKPNNVLFDAGKSMPDIWNGQCLSLIDFGLSVPSSPAKGIELRSCKQEDNIMKYIGGNKHFMSAH